MNQDLLQIYRDKLRKYFGVGPTGAIKKDAVYSQGHNFVSGELGAHLLWMLDEIPKFNDADKQQRWLGFIQGACWAFQLFSIDEMREHNRRHLAPFSFESGQTAA